MKKKNIYWKFIVSVIPLSILTFFIYPILKVKAYVRFLNIMDNGTKSSTFLALCLLISVICFVAMYIILRMKTISEKKIAETAMELNQITNSIHAGFVNFCLDSNYEIIYASKGYYDIIGFSKEEVQREHNNSIISFVLQEDYNKLYNLKEDLNIGDYIQIEVRMVTKDNSIIWMLFNGNYIVDKNGLAIISAVLVDITESKRMHQQLLMEEERYRVATEISNDILFEYDILEDRMVFAEKYQDLYGREPIITKFSNLYLQNRTVIHPEDIGIFTEYTRALRSGKEMVESEFRIQDVKMEYIWCHTRGKTIYNDKKQPVKVLGKLVNIDLHKKELQTLEYKAKRDPLTGVYNKTVTKDLIDHYLQKHGEGKHIFMIVDIDDFKKINDNYGHLQGDKILSFVISQVRKLFSSGEIIGRIGGDEFVIFIGNVSNSNNITIKAKLLQRALRTVYYEDEYEISVSGSIGISMYPEDGATYNQLLNCADKALYNVKIQGKNGYKLFT